MPKCSCCLGVDRLHLYLHLEKPLALNERTRYRDLVRPRGLREPLAYINRRREFRSISFRTVPGVLIPRPEPEHVPEAEVRVMSDRGAPKVLEIGTGSGAIAVYVGRRPTALVVATDANRVAIVTSRANAHDSGAEGKVCSRYRTFSARYNRVSIFR
jgi:release factor glutamine methyltransferase